MKITQITNKHLINRIKYFERVLESKPEPEFYDGISDYAGDWVEQENRHNENMAKDIKNHIGYMKREAKKRKLSIVRSL